MPRANFRVSIDINAPPEVVFAYITDFSKHGEWSANALTVEARSPGPAAVGSRYHSVAQVDKLRVEADFEVIEYEPPFRFGFAGEDPTGKYEHHFTLTGQAGGTHLERSISFDLTLPQWFMFNALLFPVRIPAGKKALALLKQRLEKTS